MPTMVQVTCSVCGSVFSRTLQNYNRYRKRASASWCKPCCGKRPKKIIQCCRCGKDTINPKYCSRTCAILINNQNVSIRRKPQGSCADCKRPIRVSRKYCRECLYANHRIDAPNRTLNDLFIAGSRNVYHTSVRQHSKLVATEAGLLTACAICGYSTYVECCHIKSVSSFPKTTLLSVVNAKENLIGLCPNHHQELDMGLLELGRPTRI